MEEDHYVTKLDLVVRALRQAIIDGTLPPGTPLPQQDLAEQFRISSTPIREALHRLQAEGLVETVAHKGARVAVFDEEKTREVYMIRSSLEGLAARLAAEQITPAEIERMEAHQARLRRAVHANNLVEMRRANYDFHSTLYQAARSPVLCSIIENLLASSPYDTLGTGPERALESAAQHDRILDALRARDPIAAEQATQYHVRTVAEHLFAVMRRTQQRSDSAHG